MQKWLTEVDSSEPDLPRLNELDLVRLILATAVVCQHATILAHAPILAPLGSIPAVPIFIYLSGLLVSESLKRSKNTSDYLGKRIRRILPAYITIVVIGGLLAWGKAMLARAPGTSIQSLINYFSNNLLFLNFRYPCAYPLPLGQDPNLCAVNGSLWSIKYELVFYLLLPILIGCSSQIKGKFLARSLGLGSWLALGIYSNMPIYTTIILCFLAGVGVSHWKKPILNNLEKLPATNPKIRALCAIAITGLSGAGLPLFLTLPLITLVSFYPTKPQAQALNILKFGDLSYGIYLIHFPIIQIFITSLPRNFKETAWCSLLSLAASAILAALLYQGVEKRFLGKSNHYVCGG
ncbi:MAG: acyltransferase family protein [Synechococcus lacustris]